MSNTTRHINSNQRFDGENSANKSVNNFVIQ
jgi:hypothetical protein